MKQKFLMFLSGFTLLFSYQVHADKYLGEFCWQVFNEFRDPYWSYKFNVYEKEGANFALYGSVDYDINGISAAFGNAVITNDSIKVTITSGDHEEGTEIWSEFFLARLNKDTLSGTWNTLSMEIKEGENAVGLKHNRGTIDLIACR